MGSSPTLGSNDARDVDGATPDHHPPRAYRSKARKWRADWRESVRLPVKKTYKLYIGGAFPRSESGRSYEVEGANVARASKKDVRDAVRAAREALPKWASLTAYNRGQVLYRVAEIMEGRRAQFAELVGGDAEVDEAIDRWVWYAGWADKLAQVLGSSNPVAGPYFNFTVPEPTGVVALIAPEEPPLAGLVARLAPALVGGNTAVVVASEQRPLAAITLSEVLATSDVPGGAVNVLTGRKADLTPVLAAHMDVNAIDLVGADGDRAELERLAADNVKRVVRNGEGESPWHAAAFLELKTVWHPIGV
jgi:acyl-CoA reductase-like NAD-dependent aldehyde dehydrogenase